METTEKLAAFIVDTDLERIPTEAIELAKESILDCLGVMLAGSKAPVGRMISEFVRETGGRPEATVAGAGLRTSAAEAALANGTMAHALDYDDRHSSIRGHPSATLLPAVLALGERSGASGGDLLSAYVVGFEVEARIGRTVNIEHYERGWHATATLGTMGAAAGAAKILKLNIEKTRTALGIAASRAAGIRQNFGTMTKPLHAGNAAQSGVLAAVLADKGFTADLGVLEGPFGFCNLFCGEGNYELDKITRDLGGAFEIVSPGVCIKYYPCCNGSHRALDAILHLVETCNILPHEVESVECGVPYLHPRVLAYHAPRNSLEGKFSMEFAMAIALLDRAAGLEQFTDSKVLAAETQQLMKRVHMYIHPEQRTRQSLESEFALVTVRLHDGREYSHRVDKPKGYPENPLTREQLLTKYRDCASSVMSPRDVDRSIELLAGLERLEDLIELMTLVRS
jgi:2-methylcitrate dehydratase PrpD